MASSSRATIRRAGGLTIYQVIHRLIWDAAVIGGMMEIIEISGQEPLEQVQAELVEILAPLIAAWARQALKDGILVIDDGMIKLAEDAKTDKQV